MLLTLPFLRDLILQIQYPLIYLDSSSHGISPYQTVASPRLLEDGNLSEPIGIRDGVSGYRRGEQPQERIHIVCEGCANPVLEVFKQDLLFVSQYDTISAAMFRSIVQNVPNPRSGDYAKCPFCGRELMTSLRNTWRKLKAQKNCEWDE
jgi:hypothetical protein